MAVCCIPKVGTQCSDMVYSIQPRTFNAHVQLALFLDNSHQRFLRDCGRREPRLRRIERGAGNGPDCGRVSGGIIVPFSEPTSMLLVVPSLIMELFYFGSIQNPDPGPIEFFSKESRHPKEMTERVLLPMDSDCVLASRPSRLRLTSTSTSLFLWPS